MAMMPIPLRTAPIWKGPSGGKGPMKWSPRASGSRPGPLPSSPGAEGALPRQALSEKHSPRSVAFSTGTDAEAPHTPRISLIRHG
jgi:hypothetical protein